MPGSTEAAFVWTNITIATKIAQKCCDLAVFHGFLDDHKKDHSFGWRQPASGCVVEMTVCWDETCLSAVSGTELSAWLVNLLAPLDPQLHSEEGARVLYRPQKAVGDRPDEEGRHEGRAPPQKNSGSVILFILSKHAPTLCNSPQHYLVRNILLSTNFTFNYVSIATTAEPKCWTSGIRIID